MDSLKNDETSQQVDQIPTETPEEEIKLSEHRPNLGFIHIWNVPEVTEALSKSITD